MFGEILQKKVFRWFSCYYQPGLRGVTIDQGCRPIGKCISLLMDDAEKMLMLYFQAMRIKVLITMLIPLFSMVTMVCPVDCIGQAASSNQTGSGQIQEDQLKRNKVKFKNNPGQKDQSAALLAAEEKNQHSVKNNKVGSPQPAIPNEIKVALSSIKKNKTLLSNELSSLLLTLNNEAFDPNKAWSGQTTVVRDGSNLFGAYFPGLLNEKIL